VTAGKTVQILQARLGSRRLPGKALATLAGATLLERCIARLKASGVGPVLVATTTLPEDDRLANEARRAGVSVFRGDADDVLGRFVAAASAVEAEFVIRATGDNPAVDCESPQRLIEQLRARGADHAVEDGLPYGCTVEAVRFSALREAHRTASAPEDREHVTTFLRRPGTAFRCLTPGAPAWLRRPELRFTVDTPADLACMARIFAEAGGAADLTVPLANLISIADGLARAADVA
jgi:spore coat polysaccharide biosynthesis protein SpsF (cytidylyltransferase family)